MIGAKNMETMFTRFVGQIDDLDEIVNGCEELKHLKFIINENKDSAKHLLSEEVEPLIAKLSLLVLMHFLV